MFQFPHVIANPTGAKQSEQKIMDGILRSGILNPTQRQEMDGIISTGLPENKRHAAGPDMMQVPPSATKGIMGTVHIPGTR